MEGRPSTAFDGGLDFLSRLLGALRFFLHCAHIMRRRSAPLHDNSRFESAGFTIRREEGHDFVQRNLTID